MIPGSLFNNDQIFSLNGEQIKIDSCQDSHALLRNNVDSDAYAQRSRPIMWQKERNADVMVGGPLTLMLAIGIARLKFSFFL